MRKSTWALLSSAIILLLFLSACGGKNTENNYQNPSYPTPVQNFSTPIPSFPTPIPPTPTPVIPTMAPLTPQTQTASIDGMVMVYVPAGEFYMGTNIYQPAAMGPMHQVYLDAFWIDQTEVTNAQYKLCVQAGVCPASLFSEEWITSDPQPVVGISWDNALAYCQWVGRQLPTEAQWEKAARGTDARRYPWGNEPAESCAIEAMDEGTGNGCGTGYNAPVGSYPQGASPYGAYDMQGNVWEWINDWYAEEYDLQASQTNPTGPATGTDRVIRGGGWFFRPPTIQVTFRAHYPPNELHDTIGFRCVLPEK